MMTFYKLCLLAVATINLLPVSGSCRPLEV